MAIEVIDLTQSNDGTSQDSSPRKSKSSKKSDAKKKEKKEKKREERRRDKANKQISQPEASTSAVKLDDTRSPSAHSQKANKRARSQSRSRSPERDRSAKRRRSPSPPLYRSRSPSPLLDFFVDLQATMIQGLPPVKPPEPTPKPKLSDDTLLLPFNVTVLGIDTADIQRPPTPDSDAEEYVDVLDYGAAIDRNTVRYYPTAAQQDQENSKVVLMCHRCGGDDHNMRECTVKICFTCGAREAHTTMGCPKNKTCFRCGMKGHVLTDCPNGRRVLPQQMLCDNCGEETHREEECPQIWRLYTYNTEKQRDATLERRSKLKDLPPGEGGELYIGEDFHCYNCGNLGHLGDDCREKARTDNQIGDSSAFSTANMALGPFYDPTQLSDYRTIKAKDAYDELLHDGFGRSAPTYVGRSARDKERERLAREHSSRDTDAADWFAGRGETSTSRPPKNGRREAEAENDAPKRMKFNFSKETNMTFAAHSDDREQHDRHHASSDRKHQSSHRHHRDGRERDRPRDRKHHRDHKQSRKHADGGEARSSKAHTSNRHDSDHHRGTHRDEDKASGPRYTGGYSM